MASGLVRSGSALTRGLLRSGAAAGPLFVTVFLAEGLAGHRLHSTSKSAPASASAAGRRRVADWHAAVAVDADAGDDDRHGHGVPAGSKCCAAERRAAASQLGSGGASQPGGAG